MILQRIDAFPLLAVETKQKPVFPAVYIFIAMGKEDRSRVDKPRVIDQILQHRSVSEWALIQHIGVAT